jgi:hypothetical protein
MTKSTIAAVQLKLPAVELRKRSLGTFNAGDSKKRTAGYMNDCLFKTITDSIKKSIRFSDPVSELLQ